MTGNLAPCGTLTAYQRHLRRKEPVCDECKKAKRDYEKQNAAKKRRPKEELEPVDVFAGMSRLEKLKILEMDLAAAVKWAKKENPRAIAPIAKELRETVREIAELSGEDEAKVDKFSGFFEEGGLSVVSTTG